MSTPVIQAITPNTLKQFNFLNQTWINAVSTVLTLLKDRTTFIGCSGAKLQSSTNVDTATTPTWTDLHTFPTANGQTVQCFTELPNGEALVTTNESAGATTVTHVYISSGWSVSKTAATWTDTLQTIGGPAQANYCVHDWSNAANGVVLISESGAQTLGGSANATADILKARRVWQSKDFGLTWALIFDIVTYATAQGIPYPAGVHIHGVSYDQEWDRIWICYGDGTGDGKNVAGTGYAQVLYSDDGGTTWVKLATPPYWNNSGQGAQTLQMILGVIFNNAIVFTTDLTNPKAPLVIGKTGYRQMSEIHCGPLYPSAVSGIPRKVVKDARFPTFFPGQVFSSQTSGTNWPIPVTEDDGFTWSCVKVAVPLQSPVINPAGFTQILGPTLNGKIVALGAMYINNDNTKKTMVADLVHM